MAMWRRWIVGSLFSLVMAGATNAQAQVNPFDPVWATMNQDTGGDSPGCRGCHIGPAPSFGTWFGDDEAAALDYFTNGEGAMQVSGGRNSTLARALGLVDGVSPYMPRFAPLDGRFWEASELMDLGTWLDSLGP